MNRELLKQALDALETQKNGLRWYRDELPEAVDGSDADCDAEVNMVITALKAEIDRPAITHKELFKIYCDDTNAGDWHRAEDNYRAGFAMALKLSAPKQQKEDEGNEL